VYFTFSACELFAWVQLIILTSLTEFYPYILQTVIQLNVVKALRYKPAGRGFDSRWCHWNVSVT